MFPNSTRAVSNNRAGRSAGLFSRGALAAALMLGTAGGALMIAVPASAKDKPAKEAPAQYSKEFRAAAVPLQQAYDAAKKAPADAAAVALARSKVDAAIPLAQTPDDKVYAGQLAIQISGMVKDKALERRGLELTLASGKLTGADVGRYNFYLGVNAYDSKDYVGARTAFTNAIAAGHTTDDVEAVLAETYFATNESSKGFDVLWHAIEARKAAGNPAPLTWYARGLSVAYKAKIYDRAGVFATGMVEAYPTTSNWADAIGVARTAGRYQSQETLDLMRLMERTKSFRDTGDYSEYLQAADARRAPGEVLKVLNEGVAAGKLSAGDVFVSENRTVAQARLAADKASLPALERDANAGGATLATVMAAGDAFLSYDQPAKAEGYFNTALTKPGADQARALTRIGIAQVDQGKYAEAQATFAKVTGVRQPIAKLWAVYAAQKAKGG